MSLLIARIGRSRLETQIARPFVNDVPAMLLRDEHASRREKPGTSNGGHFKLVNSGVAIFSYPHELHVEPVIGLNVGFEEDERAKAIGQLIAVRL